ncbi:MAG TPA: glutamine-hydrolyzing GMP synthase [Candidatus Paceibacterota bacterium]|nr:glutamine-hydrolyzing GMP synthase [Candidatus Paceibacterota bacterium]
MIYVFDFGSQYSQLIARRIRALGCEARLVSHQYPLQKLTDAKGIILSGGPDSVYEKEAASVSKKIFDLGVPVLGICYGMQLTCHVLGGKVQRSAKHEYGPAKLEIVRKSALFEKVPKSSAVWMSHGDQVATLPKGFVQTGASSNTPNAAMEQTAKDIYGIQFHPEVEHTEYGSQILKNFVLNICKCKPANKLAEFIEQKVAEIQKTVGKEHVICATSGGVDSSVVAALVGKAIGNQLTCIFVNSGTLRKEEDKDALKLLQDLGLNVQYVNAEKQFLRALKGVTYGEAKRKIIGKEFIAVFEKSAKQIRPTPAFLAQGTIHSDVVESAKTATGKKTQTIKSHHNVGGLPKKLNLKLLEPLRDLFKDEVREVGQKLGLPEHAVWRQPFPGPGLAVRVVGEVTKQKLDIAREADAIVTEEIEAAGLARSFYQYFAILLNDKTVGVTGDQRKYAYPVVIKAVVSSDIMTSDWARLPYDLLARISTRITSEVPQIARVLYDITPKPPGTTEWE